MSLHSELHLERKLFLAGMVALLLGPKWAVAQPPWPGGQAEWFPPHQAGDAGMGGGEWTLGTSVAHRLSVDTGRSVAHGMNRYGTSNFATSFAPPLTVAPQAAGSLASGSPIGDQTTTPADGLFEPSPFEHTSCPPNECRTLQILPDGLLFRSYLAGAKEPRFASYWNYDQDMGWLWDVTLGGRVGLWRYGTSNPFRPEGWQLDVEGAGLPRLDLDDDSDLVAVDFRFGIPLTYRRGIFESKFGYYHLSSHLGDEFMVTNPGIMRINFSRDVMVLAAALWPLPILRIYTEAGWAFASDVSEPWEFQFGAELAMPAPTGLRGAPFLAVNGHIRQEVDFGGNVVVQTGWMWRGADSGHLMRFGVEYYNGKSRQFEFFNQSEQQLGLGFWYDY